MNSPSRLLILRFSALGDVAMTIPAIYSLARQNPDLHIDVATTPFFARLFIGAPENVAVHGFDLKKEYKGSAGMLRLLKRLRALKPSMVADLHNVLRTWIIDNRFRMAGIPVIMVDKMRAARKDVLRNHKAAPSFIDRYIDVFRRLGLSVTLDMTPPLKDAVGDVPMEVTHPAVGIAPFARYYNKTYPSSSMQQVIRLLTDAGVNVYLFGGRGEEADRLGAWSIGNPRCRCVAGEFPIEKELALMGAMDAIVSMDSANHHLASLVGTPVVSLWGSTTPACGFSGFGQSPDNALFAGLDCQPCSIAGTPECPRGTLECFALLQPAAVADKVLHVIDN